MAFCRSEKEYDLSVRPFCDETSFLDDEDENEFHQRYVDSDVLDEEDLGKQECRFEDLLSTSKEWLPEEIE